jgi:Holliday junction DNA helicase RuvA
MRGSVEPLTLLKLPAPMIGRLRGILASKQPPSLLLDVAGVGYEIEAPMSTFYELPELGREVTLHIHMAVKEDAHTLYGFAKEPERSLFRTLIKVSGVGAKTALSILSGVSVDDFARLIQRADIAALQRIPGIGKKTAERLIVEMKDKVNAVGGSAAAVLGERGAVPNDPVTEASVALQALGYKPAEVSKLVQAAAQPGDSAEMIIRKALKSALRAS